MNLQYIDRGVKANVQTIARKKKTAELNLLPLYHLTPISRPKKAKLIFLGIE